MGQTIIRRIQIFALAIAAIPAVAQEPETSPTLLDYVKSHASVVSGVASANGLRSEYISVALDDDFSVASRVRGFGSLSLFGRQRDPDAPELPPDLPNSVDSLALYSAGEVFGGLYFEATPVLSVECRAGVSFSMTSITGKVGDPVDPSRYLFGCGPRLRGGPGRLSVILGHYGAITEGANLMGFVPSTYWDGEFRLRAGVSLIVRIAAGRELGTQKAVTSSWIALRKAFK